MTPTELQTFLHAGIPLARAMQLAVDAIDADGIVLRAPLAPNRNHYGTAFGGAIAAVTVMTAWSLLHARLQSAGGYTALVVKRSETEYDRPIDGDFTAHARLADATQWPEFERTLRHTGKARIAVAVQLVCGTQTAVRFTGEFVATAEPTAA